MKSRIIGIGQTGSSFFYNARLENITADCLLLSTDAKYLTQCWCKSYLIKGNNESSQNNCGVLKYAEKSAKFIEKLSPVEQLIIVSGMVGSNISLIPELVKQARKKNTKIILLLVELWRATEVDREEYYSTLFSYLKNYCNEIYGNEIYCNEIYGNEIYCNEIYCNEMKVFYYDKGDDNMIKIVKKVQTELKNEVLELLK
nr:hypothetical protein [uncultured Haemophilus sp.]